MMNGRPFGQFQMLYFTDCCISLFTPGFTFTVIVVSQHTDNWLHGASVFMSSVLDFTQFHLQQLKLQIRLEVFVQTGLERALRIIHQDK